MRGSLPWQEGWGILLGHRDLVTMSVLILNYDPLCFSVPSWCTDEAQLCIYSEQRNLSLQPVCPGYKYARMYFLFLQQTFFLAFLSSAVCLSGTFLLAFHHFLCGFCYPILCCPMLRFLGFIFAWGSGFCFWKMWHKSRDEASWRSS